MSEMAQIILFWMLAVPIISIVLGLLAMIITTFVSDWRANHDKQ